MRGWLRIALPVIVVLGLGMYGARPRPTHDRTYLEAVAAESRVLLAAYPIGPSGKPAYIPADKWPPAIAGLKPGTVTVYQGMVDITTKPSFDGGWGYGFAADERNLTMLVECWSALGHDMYWHGPC